ncbi:uncharacterized protein K460DRAFT_409637 [Cucurbitaria berberidis CBS 394.84]|uniref:Apple domain-containing protein n=1 Tax=Cucurbitaria berberidis CBS 394.84 TaxID=1168544 RepID=A0A9P4GAW2_9PLEO|nr:uncharacterized protein K460DRAFT_409637 [Cucurbitaria berberidis CBS 394.84]KAF1842220.1 hypothetical protein K460DRAFT_409637 [Cucurbitaria berberidis CBS 394.84]
MRLRLSLTLAASFNLVTADRTGNQVSTVHCALTGKSFLPAFLSSNQASYLVPAQCGALCRSKPLCQSYGIENGSCRLYYLPIIFSITKQPPYANTFYDKACATTSDMCQVNGLRSPSSPAFFISTKFADNSFAGCSTLCKGTPDCRSFSIRVENGGTCRLYKNALAADFVPKSDSLYLYWDVNCPRAVVNSGPFIGSYRPTTTVPKLSVQAAVIFPAHTSPTLLTTDSPPYTPSGPQVTPIDDNEYMSTYTFLEFPLATVNSTGLPPITTGIAQPKPIPTAPCLVEPGAQAQFSILNENYLPMVSRASNSVGPLLQPTVAPAANDPILNPEALELPGFYLQQPKGVTGAYDLVYTGSLNFQFVAMNKTGSIVLTTSSTGTDYKNGLVTSIFNFDCYGRISIEQGGYSYSWTTNGTSSKLVKESPAAENMKALPKSIPAVQSARKHRKRNHQLAKRLQKRSYTDGPAPKCPVQPANLIPKTKQGYKLGEGNFCDNLNDKWSLSPFDFDLSCGVQSLCYDQCESFGWQSCNGIFGTLMIISCADAFESWWEVALAVACVAQAGYFTGVAATSTGRELFYKAQGAMCRCFCSNPPDTCVFTNGDFYCADVLQGSDDFNCGDCGRVCGPNTKCRNGNCGCTQDQCGTTCLDFRNNANNCGSCGNICNPAYCLDGRCYVPKPGECTPEQSVANKDFSDYYPSFANWEMAAFPGCELGDKIKFAPTNFIDSSGGRNPAVLVDMSSLPNSGCQAAMVQADVKMCPGIKYELTFAMGYVNQVNNDAVVSNANCIVRWLTGTPTVWDNNGDYQSSINYNIGIGNPYYKGFGPWTLHVAKGDPGVRHFRGDLFVNLTAVISCGGATGGAGRFVIRDVKMTPVGSVKKRSFTVGEGPAFSSNRQARGLILPPNNSTTKVTQEIAPVTSTTSTPQDITPANITTNITLELEPYYPDQQPGVVLVTSFDPKVENVTNALEVIGTE